MKIKFKNFLATIESFIRNDATAVRTYQFQDRNGTIADDTDINAIKLHSWDLSTNLFPSGATFGYRGYGINGPTTSLLDRFGDPIPDGSFCECIKLVGVASTSNPLDWAIYTTVIP